MIPHVNSCCSSLSNLLQAAAERLWSPRSTRDPACAQQRLRYELMSFSSQGFKTAPLQPEWCDPNPAAAAVVLLILLLTPLCKPRCERNPAGCNNYMFSPGSQLGKC